MMSNDKNLDQNSEPDLKLSSDFGQLPRTAAIRACLAHATLSILSSGSVSFSLLSASDGFAPATSNIVTGDWTKFIACFDMGSTGTLDRVELLNFLRTYKICKD